MNEKASCSLNPAKNQVGRGPSIRSRGYLLRLDNVAGDGDGDGGFGERRREENDGGTDPEQPHVYASGGAKRRMAHHSSPNRTEPIIIILIKYRIHHSILPVRSIFYAQGLRTILIRIPIF